jgi:hypothetical protein
MKQFKTFLKIKINIGMTRSIVELSTEDERRKERMIRLCDGILKIENEYAEHTI